MINICTMKEYTKLRGDEETDISIDTSKHINYVVYSDNEDNAFVGMIYCDETCAIIGCGMDRFLSLSALLNIMTNEG